MKHQQTLYWMIVIQSYPYCEGFSEMHSTNGTYFYSLYNLPSNIKDNKFLRLTKSGIKLVFYPVFLYHSFFKTTLSYYGVALFSLML